MANQKKIKSFRYLLLIGLTSLFKLGSRKLRCNESPENNCCESPGGHALREEDGVFLPLLLRFLAQPISHTLLMGIGIQMAAFVFLPAAAPAQVVPT